MKLQRFIAQVLFLFFLAVPVLSWTGNVQAEPEPEMGTLRLLLQVDPALEQDIAMTINRVMAFKNDGSRYTVINGETVDLLEYRDEPVLLAEVDLPAGTYNQLRLNLASSSFTIDETTHDVEVDGNRMFNRRETDLFTILPESRYILLISLEVEIEACRFHRGRLRRTSLDNFGSRWDMYCLTAAMDVGGEEYPNGSPVAVDDYFELNEDEKIILHEELLGNDYDPDGDDFYYSIAGTITPPANGEIWGTVIIIPGSDPVVTAEYTPYASYNGTDSLTYRIQDEYGAVSNEATATLVIGTSVATGSIVGTVNPEAARQGAKVWLLEPDLGSTVMRASLNTDGFFNAAVADGTYDLVVSANGYWALTVEDVTVVAGEITGVGTLTLTPMVAGINVDGYVGFDNLPQEMRVFNSDTGQLVTIFMIHTGSTGIFTLTLPEGIYDFTGHPGVEILDEGGGQCSLGDYVWECVAPPT